LLLKDSPYSIINMLSNPRIADASGPITVLILGSVRHTGEGVLRKLVQEGCTIVVGNRVPDPTAADRENYTAGQIDLVDSTALGDQAESVRRETLGPDKYFNVVIYNGMYFS
jgi:NAD(P)-dependent dehydrogenase (short-subunit alcohol dehydrogenase family)